MEVLFAICQMEKYFRFRKNWLRALIKIWKRKVEDSWKFLARLHRFLGVHVTTSPVPHQPLAAKVRSHINYSRFISQIDKNLYLQRSRRSWRRRRWQQCGWVLIKASSAKPTDNRWHFKMNFLWLHWEHLEWKSRWVVVRRDIVVSSSEHGIVEAVAVSSAKKETNRSLRRHIVSVIPFWWRCTRNRIKPRNFLVSKFLSWLELSSKSHQRHQHRICWKIFN